MYFSDWDIPFEQIDFLSGFGLVEAHELEECGCTICGARQHELYVATEGLCCEDCAKAIVASTIDEAREFAQREVKITSPFPTYPPELEYACTPEEYRMGDRESHTPNAHNCYCRHACTNYDELLKELDRDSIRDGIYYNAIRYRIDELGDEENNLGQS